MVKMEFFDSPDLDWDKRIFQSHIGRYQQTSHQAMHLSTFRNYKPIFVLFKKDGKIVGQQLLFLRPRGTSFIKKSLGKFTEKFYFWHNSILIFDQSFQDEILKSFTSFIEKKKFVGLDSPIAKYHLELPYSKVGTVILNIKESFEDTISDRDPTSTQKHVAMAAYQHILTSKKVRAKQIETNEEIKTYFTMLNEHRKNLGIKTITTFSSIQDRIVTLNKYKYGGALLAYHENFPISGIIYFNYNGWIHNLSVANTLYSLKNKLSSLDYLRCYLIAIGVKTYAKFFDVGGIALNPKNKKEEGIRHSQTKWGGKIVEYNRYSNI
jgi:hypothetical protein